MRHQSASLPPNPSLIAILLVTRSRTGPRLVFHYPAVPTASAYSTKRDPHWYGTPGTATDDSAADSDDWDTSSSESTGGGGESDDGEDSSMTGSRRSGRTRSTRGGLGKDEVDEEVLDEDDEGGLNGRRKQQKGKKDGEIEWERVLGFSAEGLSYLLSPPKSFNKRKLEVGIEQFIFLGAPMFQRDDGYWKKRRRHRKREQSDANLDPHEAARSPDGIDGQDMSGNDVVPEVKPLPKVDSELFNVPGFDAGYGHGMVSNAPSDFGGSDDRSTSTAADEREMVMFNIVFVMNPPSLEHHLRVDEMYDYIVKRFAKVLKVEQAQNNYIATESRLIHSIKDKGKESKAPISTLWPSIVAQSSLARSIALMYDAISSNKIAHVDLKGFDMSFQIPQAISTPFAPTTTEPQMPGLWLTTATLIDDDDMDASLSPHATLLLLEDDDTLLKEVESDGKELSGPLAIFIRNLAPTKSLLKLSQRHSMALKDVQFLARHLIYWRRARAIPPLHYRDTYVVSPNADMRALAIAIPAFAARFPTLPPLTKILHSLSGPPRQYRMLMPSQDHRTAAYMDILAWLMRGGWVTQLRTFAWIRVSREVKAAVAAKQNRDARHSSMIIEQPRDASGNVTTQHTRENSENSVLSSPRVPDIDMNVHLSPHLSPYARAAGPASENGSTSSTRTAIASLSALTLSPLQRPDSRMLHRPSPLHINQSASPSEADDIAASPATTALRSNADLHSNSNNTVDSVNLKSENAADYEPSLIQSPQRATNEESAWIEHIGTLITDMFPDNVHQPSTPGATNGSLPKNGTLTPDTGPTPRQMWPIVLKYFDGRYALEEISAREGIKKKKVREFWGRLVREGILVTVRHW